MKPNANTGTIRKAKKEKGYSQISNDVLNNMELSFKARGILAYILSKPDDWVVYISDLARGVDKQKSVRSGINELIEHRYVQRYAVYDAELKRIDHWETLVSETPFKEEELISNVWETYLKDENGEKIYQTIRLEDKERKIPIIVNRKTILLSQKGKEGEIINENLLSQKVKVGKFNQGKEALQIQNNTNTDFFSNTDISNNSSKGKSHQAIRYEKIIGKELGKTVLPKFENHIKNLNPELVEAILVYAEETSARTYQWFEDRVCDCKAKGHTAESFTAEIEAYREGNRKRKNSALKAKDEKAKAMQDAHELELAGHMVIEKADDVVFEADLEGAVDISEDIKAKLCDIMTVNTFKLWVEPYTFMLNKNHIYMNVPNIFSKGVIENNYENTIVEAIRELGYRARLVVTVDNKY